MNARIIGLALAGVFSAWLLSGCGSSCSASNCAGCCDAAGVCQGASVAHCGVNGAACETCVAAQECVLGTCSFVGGNGNGTGTGSGNNSGTGASSGTTCTNCGTSTGSTGTSSTTQGSSSTASSTGTTEGSANTVSSTGGSSAAASTTGTGGTSGSISASSTTGASSSSSTTTTGTSSSSATSTTGTSSSSTTGTSATSTTGTSGTGTTTGGTCPSNVPDILDGQTNGPCNNGACATGYTCVNNACVLNGAAGEVQVTLSWDALEDLDVHVVEPNGCAIWYGNTNRPTGTSQCSASGSLDRDSNAGCQTDGINIENVICPSSGVPSGTYSVIVDEYEHCDASTSFNFAVQVRVNGVVTEHCGTLLASDQDTCASANSCPSGKVFTFTVP
ncbi:MAG: hypothetical protein JST54_30450 [Deltaproteobacteria bacterium]|nr:hypothetical protein [Deltaproteobacteria bacterium]